MTTSTSTDSLARRAVLGAAVAALIVLSGCSGSNPTAEPTTPSATTGATPPSTSTTPTTAAPTATPVPVESNPPGDIPDNLAFVPYANKVGRYTFTHPEGWARTGRGSAVRFTDKLNGVAVDSRTATSAPTPASARASEVPALSRTVPAFELRSVSAVTVPAGNGVRIVFRRNSAPDPVTGKVYRDEVEEYLVFAAGRVVAMDLYGPVGADNVDAYRTMSQSLVIR